MGLVDHRDARASHSGPVVLAACRAANALLATQQCPAEYSRPETCKLFLVSQPRKTMVPLGYLQSRPELATYDGCKHVHAAGEALVQAAGWTALWASAQSHVILSCVTLLPCIPREVPAGLLNRQIVRESLPTYPRISIYSSLLWHIVFAAGVVTPEIIASLVAMTLQLTAIQTLCSES